MRTQTYLRSTGKRLAHVSMSGIANRSDTNGLTDSVSRVQLIIRGGV